jgi:hypothetical protein
MNAYVYNVIAEWYNEDTPDIPGQQNLPLTSVPQNQYDPPAAGDTDILTTG